MFDGVRLAYGREAIMMATMSQPAGRSEKRRRSDVVSVRLSPDERAAIEELARTAGVQVGTLLRQSALGVRPEAIVRPVPSGGLQTAINAGPTSSSTVVLREITAAGAQTAAGNG